MSPDGPRYEYEIVGIFRSVPSLEAAIGALTNAGWDRAEMSLLGSKAYVAPSRSTRDLADSPDVDRTAVTSQTDVHQAGALGGALAGVVAGFLASGATIMSGGTALAAVIGAAAAAGGGAVGGGMLGRALSRDMSKPLDEQLARGGIVLWVLLRSREQEALARDILGRHGADDVHVHARADVT
ncbi:MAG: hypothetical protein ACM30I_00600 [Gemmatimonas sp.]